MQPDSAPGQDTGAPPSTPTEADQPYSITGLATERPKAPPVNQAAQVTPPITSIPTESMPSTDQTPAQQFVETQKPQPQNTEVPTTVPAQQFVETQGLEASSTPSSPEPTVQPAPDVVAGLNPAISGEAQFEAHPTQIHEPKTAQELKDLENFNTGSADLKTNSGTPLDETTTEQVQATVDTQQAQLETPLTSAQEESVTQHPMQSTENQTADESTKTPNYESLFEKWNDLGPTALTQEFNSFMLNLKTDGKVLDSSTEEGLVRVYTTLLLKKSGITLETNVEKKWD